MPPHTVITTMLRGLLGTLAQIIVVYGVVLLVAGYGLDSAALDVPTPTWLRACYGVGRRRKVR